MESEKEFMARQVKKMRAAVGVLEAYLKYCKRGHKRLNTGHDCYDPINYYTSEVMTYAANLRTMLQKGEENPIRLADGSTVMGHGGRNNNRGTHAKIPLKYLAATANNPDDQITAEERKIRYMPMGRCGR